MATYYDQNKYNSLRETYQFFRFQRYDYTLENEHLSVKYYFSLDDKYFFIPSFDIPKRKFYDFNNLNNSQLDVILFNIGMIELISYWKLACPKRVYIQPFKLDDNQIRWWKKLYFNGLGEFFYLNGIKENVNDFMEIINESEKSCDKINIQLKESTLVPVGGGKDSVVTLELLKNKMPIIPLIINPRGATTECVTTAGFSEEQVAVIKRTLDPTMLKMNNEGFLNDEFICEKMFLSSYNSDKFYVSMRNYKGERYNVGLSKIVSVDGIDNFGEYLESKFYASVYGKAIALLQRYSDELSILIYLGRADASLTAAKRTAICNYLNSIGANTSEDVIARAGRRIKVETTEFKKIVNSFSKIVPEDRKKAFLDAAELVVGGRAKAKPFGLAGLQYIESKIKI